MVPPFDDDSIGIGRSDDPSCGGPVEEDESRPSFMLGGDGGGGSSRCLDFFFLPPGVTGVAKAAA